MPDPEMCQICGDRQASVFGADDDWDGQLDPDEAICGWCALMLYDRETTHA